MDEFKKPLKGLNPKIEVDQQEFLEMQCDAAIGRFVKEFEFLTSMIRDFLKPCLLRLGWEKAKINNQFAKLPTGGLINLLEKYKEAFPDDKKGNEALQNFISILEKVNEGRIQLLHGYHMVDIPGNSFTTTKAIYMKDIGKKIHVTLLHTSHELDHWVKIMSMMSRELWMARENVKKSKSIHKSLVAGNYDRFKLPELGEKIL